MTKQQLYNRDFYAWTLEQAALLRNHQWEALDIENLAEEIESFGKLAAARTEESPGRVDWAFAEVGIST